MTTRRTLHDLEISQSPDQLVIRGRKLAVVLSVIAIFLLVPLSLDLTYKNIVGSAQLPAIWQRTTDARIVSVVAILFILLLFGVMPIAICLMFVRRRYRPWVFDLHRRQLTRHHQSWSFEDFTDVAVDVRRTTYKRGATVILHIRNVETLEVARFYTGNGKGSTSLESRIALASALATTIGEFLQVPVRHPTPAGQGFEVVMPVRS